MSDEATWKICPVCKKPVDPKAGIYRFLTDDYHRECFEQTGASSTEGQGASI